MAQNWSKSGWRSKPSVQMPAYPDLESLAMVEKQLSQFPPLVFAGEVRQLRQELARVCRGEAFLLQGGDCAESFEEFNADSVRDTFRILLQMAIILTFSAKRPVVKLGRIAGQFAKPRSAEFEIKGDKKLPSFRGDIINEIDFNEAARVPKPGRMLQAYTQSAATINLLRAFSQGGYADIHRLHAWTLGFTEGEEAKKYQDLSCRITDALDFINAAGLNSDRIGGLKRVNFYTSHEALLLNYEEALCRIDSTSGEPIAGSGHLVWIGDRTRQPDGAHVDFCRGVQNPIGIKCGPSLSPSDLCVLLDRLNPSNEEGKILLISRFGAGKVSDHLPALIQSVKNIGANVAWCCDPMHGNTVKSKSGFKTRRFDCVRSELSEYLAVHNAEGSYPGGVHFEMTGKDVTECTGGVSAVSDENLKDRYHTFCDPRLNSTQSLELAFLLAEEMSRLHPPAPRRAIKA